MELWFLQTGTRGEDRAKAKRKPGILQEMFR
jgi:hypothetical protein